MTNIYIQSMVIPMVAILLLSLYLWQKNIYRHEVFFLRPRAVLFQLALIICSIEVIAMLLISVFYPNNSDLFKSILIDITVLLCATLPLIYFVIIRPFIKYQNKNLHILTDNVIDGVIMIDIHGIIQYCNPAGEQILGYGHNELLSQPITMIMEKDDQEKYRAVMREYIKSNKKRFVNRQSKVHAKRKDGNILTAYLTISEVELNKKTLFIGIIKDITEQENLTNELGKAEKNLRTVINRLSGAQRIAKLGSWHWDIAANKLLWSDEVYRIFDVELQLFDPTYDAFISYVHPDDRVFVQQSVNEAIYDNKTYNIQYRLILADGTIKIVQAQGEVTFGSDRKALQMAGTIQDITERVRIDEKLQKTTKRLTEAQKIARIGNWEWDIAEDRIKLGDEIYEIFGLPPEQPISTFEQFMSIVHPYDRILVSHKINEAINHRQNYSESITHTLVPQDGKTYYVNNQAKIYFDKEGKPLKVLGILQDITENALMEEDLKESEERFKNVAEYAQDAIIIIGNKGNIIYCNKSVERIFGYKKHELLGKELHAIIVPSYDYGLYHKGLENFSKTGEGPVIGKTAEFTAVRKNKEKFPIELTISAIKVKDNWQAVGILRDITERKLAEANRTMLAEIVESSNDAIISKDMNNIIISWNKGAEMVYGYKADEAIGQPISILIPNDYIYEIAECMEKIKKGEKIIHHETKRKRKDGTIIDVSITASILTNSNGTITGISTITRDVSKQKKIGKELIRAKEAAETANRAKTEFLANMSHEIRTPMNSVLGMTDMLRETNPNDEQKQYIDILKKSAGQLINLINDILDISKVEEGHAELHLEEFDIYNMLNNIKIITKTESDKKGLSLNFNTNKLIPRYLSGDANKINRILLNIIGNAIKFTNNGEVSINVGLSPVTAETKLTSNEVELLFSVKDTGIGIPEDKLEYIFERFSQVDSSVTRQYGGTGLGLFISKRLIAMMGGTIRVESELDKGSMFYFTIKLGVVQKTLPQIPEQTVATQQETQEKKYDILLVEDAEDNRDLIKLYLKKLPYNIDTATNGAIAVDKVKQNRYDIILMDIQMPVMDGYVATSLIREWETQNGLTPAPIITLTANAFKEDEEKSYAAGCSAYLTKPIKKALLLETMNQYL